MSLTPFIPLAYLGMVGVMFAVNRVVPFNWDRDSRKRELDSAFRRATDTPEWGNYYASFKKPDRP